ncbi:PAS domain-containing protein [Kordiimonas sp. SCSIO 12610]|uniref:PAS domain-containing protein n=1 Tax=Kordiimonas sp. SCSIO 12610 TaxID=2829597 RepID=UPI00210872C5|nr:PAS domain-containing protein [Kordiimonas sp. SCSIO 12610]UTW54236.1 PAS domain-containing protein [Kordiimonas sp. SCSIO 12610]
MAEKLTIHFYMFEIIDIHELQSSAFCAPFQSRALHHWLDISDGRKFPLKRNFRPQLFSNFLPQFAIIALGESLEKHQTRLMGTAVMEVLGIANSNNHLLATQNPYLSDILKKMLEDVATTTKPSFYRMTHDFDQRLSTFNFTALSLPFSASEDNDTFDMFILAFDFSESNDIKRLDNMTHPLYTPANKTSMI